MRDGVLVVGAATVILMVAARPGVPGQQFRDRHHDGSGHALEVHASSAAAREGERLASDSMGP